MSDINQKRHELRTQLRAFRRTLSPTEQHDAALQLARLMIRQPLFRRCRTLGCYVANDGELDPYAVLNAALGLRKRCYLPVLRPLSRNRLWFVPYHHTTPLQLNRYGIPEPVDTHNPIPLATLDVVLMPLVGFDQSGGRLGMGGGYYDRSFSFKQRVPHAKPVLVGLAHSGQEVGELATQNWDIAMDAVATERGVVLCNPHAARHFATADLLISRQR